MSLARIATIGGSWRCGPRRREASRSCCAAGSEGEAPAPSTRKRARHDPVRTCRNALDHLHHMHRATSCPCFLLAFIGQERARASASHALCVIVLVHLPRLHWAGTRSACCIACVVRHRSRGAVDFLVIADKWQVLSAATLALSQLEATLKPCRLIQWSWLPNSVLMAALVARGSEFVASAEWLALDSGGWPMPRRVCRQGIRRRRCCLGQSGVQHDELGARGLSPKS